MWPCWPCWKLLRKIKCIWKLFRNIYFLHSWALKIMILMGETYSTLPVAVALQADCCHLLWDYYVRPLDLQWWIYLSVQMYLQGMLTIICNMNGVDIQLLQKSNCNCDSTLIINMDLPHIFILYLCHLFIIFVTCISGKEGLKNVKNGGGDYPCPDFLASSLAIQNCDLANFLKLVKKKVAQSVRLSVGQGMQSLLGHVGNFLE